MPVESQHEDYKKAYPLWRKCRAVIMGEEAVKAEETLFLPILEGQGYMEYLSYRDRALFYAATARTLEGLSGAIFRKKPEIMASPEALRELDSISSEGLGLEAFLRGVVSEVLTTGRYGILVDMESQNGKKAYLSGYAAENVINWRAERKGGLERLKLVVLRENYLEAGEDYFSSKKKVQYRVLRMDEENRYRVSLFRYHEESERYSSVEEFIPRIRGNPLDFIPFVFCNPCDQTTRVFKPPLADLASVNLSHYRTSADLEHGRHFTALPTVWVAGFDAETELKIGSQTAWVAENPDAKAGYLEFTGQGLSALENAMKEKQDLMAVLGARLLEEPKKAVEAAQTHRLRRIGENSILASLARSISKTVNSALDWWAMMSGETGKVCLSLNNDFLSGPLEAKEITALMDAWIKGAMSWDSLIFNFKKGEILPEDRTKQQEKELIELEHKTEITSEKDKKHQK
ncbi:MAG: DUF4055 domain-containing protein [Deltaproteobacteria bacterium]|nr:DUF4055 domain-containing protein [Deltaproteobacteria bacterium]